MIVGRNYGSNGSKRRNALERFERLFGSDGSNGSCGFGTFRVKPKKGTVFGFCDLGGRQSKAETKEVDVRFEPKGGERRSSEGGLPSGIPDFSNNRFGVAIQKGR